MNPRGSRPKVRPPRKGLSSANGDVDFEKTWQTLSECLRQMHTKNASTLSFEEIYRYAYKIVLKKSGEQFYERLHAFEADWLRSQVRPKIDQHLSPVLLATSADTTSTMANERRSAGEAFLRTLKDAFEDHQQVMNMATDVFMYLDRVFCADNHRPSIYVSAMVQFRDNILRSTSRPDTPQLAVILNRVILEQIAMERDGDVIDKTLIKSCVFMLEGLYESTAENEEERLYLTSFEQDFIEDSRDFYRGEATRLLQQNDAAAYCLHTFRRINQEQDRCRSTLSETTTPKITAVLEDELIRNKIGDLIAMDSGVKHMIDNDLFSHLEQVYMLNTRIDPNKAELIKAMQDRIAETGLGVNEAATAQSQPGAAAPAGADGEEQEGRPKPSAATRAPNQITNAALQWVESVLSLKSKYDSLWERSLKSDPVIQPALTHSFKDLINSLARSSEFISLFIDENMKKGLKDKSEAEVDQILERAITLLRYVSDKDMFERYYKKHLCKRLLMGKSVSIDAEKQMISRMKIELGNSFTAKMEAMFKDMAVSEELTAGYKTRANATADKRAELSINVLTSMTWPLETMQSSSSESEAQRMRCTYPPEIERIKKGFENFYAEKHQGRMLTWLPHMGSADIRATFPASKGAEGRLGKERRHELNVSTYSMIILLLFNDMPSGSSLTFDQIQSRTSIPTNELIRNLQGLAVAPKTRVLVKQPMSKEVKPTDRFTFNESFSSQFMKIKVGVVAANNKVEGERDRRETERKNNEARGYVIEATIVRIMKQRKELTHQQLVSETLSQLAARFHPDVTMIKQRIESLIEREYLERIEDSNPSAYRYLA